MYRVYNDYFTKPSIPGSEQLSQYLTVYSYGIETQEQVKSCLKKSLYTQMLSFLVYLAVTFYHMLTIIRYIEIYFMIALLDCVRYNEDFVKWRFCSIHFTVILTGLEKIVRHTEDFVI